MAGDRAIQKVLDEFSDFTSDEESDEEADFSTASKAFKNQES